MTCKCPSSSYAIDSPPALPSPESPPPWAAPNNCNCQSKCKGDSERVGFKKTVDAAQETKESELQSTGFTDSVEGDAISDAASVSSTVSTDSKKKKKRSRKKQKKPKKTKSKKKIKKTEEKPKRKSCCIRLLKIMCCGSACV